MINLKLFENFHTKGQLKKMYINYLISTNQVRKKQSGDGYILNSGTSVVVKNKFNEQPSQEFIIDYLIKFFKKGHNFLDIGCGLGNVVFIADKIGYNSTGIEINKKNSSILSKLDSNIKIIYDDIYKRTDILKNMDVIYLYRPMWKIDKLFKIIIEECKVGTTIIFNYGEFSKISLNLLRCFDISDEGFILKVNDKKYEKIYKDDINWESLTSSNNSARRCFNEVIKKEFPDLEFNKMIYKIHGGSEKKLNHYIKNGIEYYDYSYYTYVNFGSDIGKLNLSAVLW